RAERRRQRRGTLAWSPQLLDIQAQVLLAKLGRWPAETLDQVLRPFEVALLSTRDVPFQGQVPGHVFQFNRHDGLLFGVAWVQRWSVRKPRRLGPGANSAN